MFLGSEAYILSNQLNVNNLLRLWITPTLNLKAHVKHILVFCCDSESEPNDLKKFNASKTYILEPTTTLGPLISKRNPDFLFLEWYH